MSNQRVSHQPKSCDAITGLGSWGNGTSAPRASRSALLVNPAKTYYGARVDGRFPGCIARKKGHKVALRVTEIPRVKPMRPRQIKRIRLALGASQSMFPVYSECQSQRRSELGTRRTAADKRGSQTFEHRAKQPANTAAI